MLPEYQQQYQHLKQALEQLQERATRANLDGASLQAEFLEVQQFFQVHIVPIDQELEPFEAQQVQSYNTEINKQLRLLGMDAMFLQAARQSATAQQRQAQMRDRLRILIGYCDALLEEKKQ